MTRDTKGFIAEVTMVSGLITLMFLQIVQIITIEKLSAEPITIYEPVIEEVIVPIERELTAAEIEHICSDKYVTCEEPAPIVKAPLQLVPTGAIPELIQSEGEAAGLSQGEIGQLKSIAYCESTYDPSAKNPNSTAKGLFQFIDSTAQSVGLSDPYDPVESTQAAIRLYQEQGYSPWASCL